MAEPKKKTNPPITDTNPPEEEMSDEEVAELGARLLSEKDREIASLKKQVNKMKLLSAAPEEEEQTLTEEECLKVIGDPHSTNYDYAVAAVGLHNIAVEEGRDSPLGEMGQEVADFFQSVIDRCDGDKSVFPSVYQSMIGPDDKAVAMAYKQRKNK